MVTPDDVSRAILGALGVTGEVSDQVQTATLHIKAGEWPELRMSLVVGKTRDTETLALTLVPSGGSVHDVRTLKPPASPS